MEEGNYIYAIPYTKVFLLQPPYETGYDMYTAHKMSPKGTKAPL
jgi:hypothetical protein